LLRSKPNSNSNSRCGGTGQDAGCSQRCLGARKCARCGTSVDASLQSQVGAKLAITEQPCLSTSRSRFITTQRRSTSKVASSALPELEQLGSCTPDGALSSAQQHAAAGMCGEHAGRTGARRPRQLQKLCAATGGNAAQIRHRQSNSRRGRPGSRRGGSLPCTLDPQRSALSSQPSACNRKPKTLKA